MNKTALSVLVLLVMTELAIAVEPAAAPAPAAPPAPAMSADECAVWNRELSFAASVDAHDAAAFRQHVHADAVFVGGRGELTRGVDAVAASWAPIIAGEEIVLHWHPRVVSIAGETGVALSRGPYWIEDPKPDADPKYMIGQFISTWVKDADGHWQVLFDGGGGNRPQPATADEVAALKAGLPNTCP